MKITGIPYVQGRNTYADPDGAKYGIAIHNTSNDASAEAEAAYATRRIDGVSAHFYVDGDSIIQSLDTAARAGHAGSSTGNNNAIAVEITGVNGWSRAQWLANVAWDKLGATLAQVAGHYGIAVRRATVTEMKTNPKVKAFYSHDDMRRAWGGTDHTDPGPNFPWDRLFTAVNAAITGGTDMAALEPTDPSYVDLIYSVAAIVDNTPTVLGGPDVGKPNKLQGALAAIASQASSNGAGISEIKTALAQPVVVDLTEAQLDSLADKVVARLGALRFEASGS